MPPKKKEAKKVEKIEEKEPEIQPQVQQIETEGFGRFEYRDSTVYEGGWKLNNNIKMKHGEGILIHAGYYEFFFLIIIIKFCNN